MGRMPNVEPEVIVIWGNLPALPDDSPSSTVPGTVRYAGWNIAPFPLTLTLSLGEREQLESRSGKPTVHDFSAERMAHPLPKGEGWGEGKESTAPLSADARAYKELSAGRQADRT